MKVKLYGTILLSRLLDDIIVVLQIFILIFRWKYSFWGTLNQKSAIFRKFPFAVASFVQTTELILIKFTPYMYIWLL